MDFVLEVGGLADAAEGAAGVDVVEPLVNFLVVFKGKVDPLFGSLDDETVGFELHAFYVGNIADFEHTLLLRRLFRIFANEK